MKNKKRPTTRNIAKKGFSGMQSSSPASSSLYLDSDVLRNPFLAILPPLWATQIGGSADKIANINDRKTEHIRQIESF